MQLELKCWTTNNSVFCGTEMAGTTSVRFTPNYSRLPVYITLSTIVTQN